MHEGHRQRMYEKLKTGDRLFDHELLEMLLFNACPRKDLNATAHSILNKFSSLFNVFKASVDELMQVEGVGQSMAEYLVCLGKCLELSNGGKSFALVKSTFEFKKFISERMLKSSFNGLEVYCLDVDGRIRRARAVSVNEADKRKSTFEEILAVISVYKPYGVYAAYFRQGESVQPENADDDTVALISKACNSNGVKFYDYCIACRGGEDIFSYFVADRLVSAFSQG